MWELYKIYERPFSIVNRNVNLRTPTRYTSIISNIDEFSMGFLGNTYHKNDSIIGCSSNITYRPTASNTFFDTDALTEHHKDTIIFRDSL